MITALIEVAEMLQIMSFFFFNDTATTEIYTLSLHDALPISWLIAAAAVAGINISAAACDYVVTGFSLNLTSAHGTSTNATRSEEHTSELQSPCNLVCRLLLEKKKKESPTFLNKPDSLQNAT